MKYTNFLEVVKEPLGLIGLILFFVFGALSQKKRMPSWWPIASFFLASVALLGGLFLALAQIESKIESENHHSAEAKKEQEKTNHVEATGDGAIANTGNIGGDFAPVTTITKTDSKSFKHQKTQTKEADHF